MHERSYPPASPQPLPAAGQMSLSTPAAGKATQSSHLLPMRIQLIILSFLLLVAVQNNLASVGADPGAAPPVAAAGPVAKEREGDGDRLERQQQLPAITAAFALRTTRARAHRLAYLCYETTLDTPFKPIDLAEIALAETGGHYLSSHAVSSEGALGVWQLMPQRARSHGYSPAEMKHDEKCAAAAVRELKEKLKVADGNLMAAKRLYCGSGRQARIYETKIRKYRREIMGRMAAARGGNPAPAVSTS